MNKEFKKFELYPEYTLIKNINIFRLFNDLSKTQFAYHCDISATALDSLRKRKPSDKTYQKLSRFTGIPIRILKKLAITEDELDVK